MTLPVRLSKQAKLDVADIHDWLFERSPQGALSWLDALDLALSELPNLAQSCSAAVEGRVLGLDLRQHFFKTRRGRKYRMVFTHDESMVQVLTVRAPGQDLLKLGDIVLP